MARLRPREQVARRMVIVGGGNVGLHLAQALAREAPLVSLKVIEHCTRARRAHLARTGSAAVVLHGDALDKEVLEEAQCRAAETIVAVTNDDETNIFASVLAKREGCQRAITLVNKASYEPCCRRSASMWWSARARSRSPPSCAMSAIARSPALYTLREDFGEVIEAEALEGSRLVSGPAAARSACPKACWSAPSCDNGEVIIPTARPGCSPATASSPW